MLPSIPVVLLAPGASGRDKNQALTPETPLNVVLLPPLVLDAFSQPANKPRIRLRRDLVFLYLTRLMRVVRSPLLGTSTLTSLAQ